MAEILFKAKLDQGPMSEELKKAEQLQIDQQKQMVERKKLDLDITSKKIVLEGRINQLYAQRLRLINQIDQKETSMLGKAAAQARLIGNTVQMTRAAGQYGQTVKGKNGVGTSAAILAGSVGIGNQISNLTPMVGNGSSGTISINNPTLRHDTSDIDAIKDEKELNELIRKNNLQRRLDVAERKGDLRSAAMIRKRMSFGGKKPSIFGRFFGSPSGKMITGALTIGALVRGSMEEATKAYEGGRSLEMSAENYQRYANASERSGMGHIEDIYGKYQETRHKALGGDSDAMRTMRVLGVNDYKDAQKGFDELIESLKKVKPNTDNMREAMNMFGESTNKVINNVDKFTDAFSSMSVMSDTTVKQLMYLKDTTSDTFREIYHTFGGFLGWLGEKVANVVNGTRAGFKGTGAFLKTVFSGGSINEGIDAGAKTISEFESGARRSQIDKPKVDATVTAGYKLEELDNVKSGISVNRFQKMGMFNGGEPVQAFSSRWELGLLRKIEANTKQTADGLK